ncbi:MAG: hypothetical protein IPL32_02425 [Chloracidobacterium sp.]|nr:hypothetical protein [Chloracidobacterium sp.]
MERGKKRWDSGTRGTAREFLNADWAERADKDVSSGKKLHLNSKNPFHLLNPLDPHSDWSWCNDD